MNAHKLFIYYKFPTCYIRFGRRYKIFNNSSSSIDSIVKNDITMQHTTYSDKIHFTHLFCFSLFRSLHLLFLRIVLCIVEHFWKTKTHWYEVKCPLYYTYSYKPSNRFFSWSVISIQWDKVHHNSMHTPRMHKIYPQQWRCIRLHRLFLFLIFNVAIVIVNCVRCKKKWYIKYYNRLKFCQSQTSRRSNS